jgi:16S rRNA (guanine527-N7)-methyltransferase
VPIREKLARRASKAGLSLPGEVADGLHAYFELLRKWNRKVSLTALPVEDAGDEAVDRLLVEPVLAARYLPKPDAALLDLGSGGGSPAVPIKITAPKVTLRMVESKTRKAAFLREVVRSLSLDQTLIEAVRFEELLARPAMHDAFDVVTMRAVRVDRKIVAQVQSFIRPGGALFLFGSAAAPGVAEIAVPHLTLLASHALLKQWGSHLHILAKPNENVPRGTG